MILGREASEEGDKTSNIIDKNGSVDEFQILVVKKESRVFKGREGRGGDVEGTLGKKKKNHCNDATEGNRGS